MNRKGFSFVELIVSALILSLVIAGVFGSFAMSRRFVTRTQWRADAVDYARAAMDTLRMVEYNNTALDNTGWRDLPAGLYTLPGGFRNRTENANLQYRVVDRTTQGYKRIDVRVKWDLPALQ